jgi:hypothetical protein
MHRPHGKRNEGDRNGRRRSRTAPGRTAYRRGRRVSRSPGLRHRTGFRPQGRPPRPALQLPGRSAKHREPIWEVLDDLPKDIAVLPGELRIIETYLAQLLDGSLGPRT